MERVGVACLKSLWRCDRRTDLSRGRGCGVDSFSPGNEAGDAGLDDGIEPDPRRDSFVDLPHGAFRKGENGGVFLEPAKPGAGPMMKS